MPMVLIPLLVLLIFTLIGVGVFCYVSAKGIARLTKLFSVSPLPQSVKRSLRESHHYGRLIMRTVQQHPAGPLRDRLNLTVKPVGEWLSNLAKLEKGLEKSYGQRNLTRELRQTTFEMENLRRQLILAEEKEAIYLQDLMLSKKNHLRVLKELQAFQTQAELKIRKITSDLGTTHAEILLILARGDFNENRLHRLDENLQDNLSSMRDILLAMDELGYSSRLAR